MFSFKMLASQILFPFEKAMWTVRCKIERYHCLRLKNCTFYGSADFILLCENAVQKLSTLDKAMHDSLLMGGYLIWEEPAGSMNYAKRLCGIAPEFVAWRELGILVCITWTVFLNELAYSRPALMFDKRLMNELITKASRDAGTWLQEHDFPQVLVECYIHLRKVA
jgi:hypothetical protein